METKLEIFIKSLDNFIKNKENKKIKINDKQYVYLIENIQIISVRIKYDLNKIHIIVEEIFNPEIDTTNIELFCKKYYSEWVSYYDFNGIIMQKKPFKGTPQFKNIMEQLPELELEKRFNEWKGKLKDFTIFELEEKGKKGYALISKEMFEKEEIKEKIESSIIEYVRRAIKENKNKLTNYITYDNYIQIIFDKTFIEIIKNRYLNKIKENEETIIFKIKDLKKFDILEKTKDQYSLDVFEKLHKNKYIKNEIKAENVYKINEQVSLPKFEERNKEYIYASVEYLAEPEKTYYYMTDDENIKLGDLVLVIANGYEAIGIVAKIEKCKIGKLPYPLEKTRKIISKIEDIRDLQKYGVTIPKEILNDMEIEDQELDEIDFDDDENGKYISEINQTKNAYHIIKVAIKSRKSIENIIEKLYDQHLIASSKKTTIESTFIWKNQKNAEERYKLELITRGDKLAKIKLILEKLNDRKNAKIFGSEIENISEKMKNEIDRYLDKLD